MFTINQGPDRIVFIISSELHFVDQIIHVAQQFIKNFKIREFSGFKLVLRELLNNAIEHGNYNISRKKVTCSILHIRDKKFQVIVEDEGRGFDYDHLNLSIPEDPRQLRNRGYALINAFSERINFNEKGNRVTVYLSFVDETTYHILEDGDWSIIIPSGNLTATTADSLRIRLIELLMQGNRQYRFDFKHVDDIDSITLSILIIFARTVSSSKKRNDTLEVINMNNDLRELFQMTRMDQLYQVVR